MTLEILQSAKDDLRAGRLFYERQGGRSLGAYFFDTMFSAIESLSVYAGIHPKRFNLFWMLTPHFPYSVYYDVEGGTVIVYAVIDNRRNPDWIQAHLNASRLP